MMLISKQFLNKVKSSIVVGPPEFNFRVDKICQIAAKLDTRKCLNKVLQIMKLNLTKTKSKCLTSFNITTRKFPVWVIIMLFRYGQ